MRWPSKVRSIEGASLLAAQMATKDKRVPAALLHRYLDRAEREASDERNFVKKAVSWAIREIGQRSAARWVGSDALRELTSPKVAQRVARREETGRERGRAP